jgi:hypothetical protein
MSAVGEASRPDEQVAQAVRVGADVRTHDLAVLEQDRPLVVPEFRDHGQRPRLPAQVEQLEDVVDAELLERAFDRH